MLNKKENSAALEEYWQKKIDSKKVVISYLEKIWVIAIGTAIGILIAIATYFVYHAITDGVLYEAYSEFYLDFATDEKGDAIQYYNGYTWNDLMTTNLIADGTMSRLDGTNVTLGKLEEVTLAEVKSDIRVLRVTITDSDKDLCAKIQKATEGSLEELGDSVKEFTDIKTIKSVEPVRVYADNRLKQAILLGALCGLIITLIGLWFKLILDDYVKTPSDLYGIGIPVAGVMFKNTDYKPGKRLGKLAVGNEEYLAGKLGNNISADEIVRINASDILLEDQDIDFDKLRQAKAVILEIPFGKVKSEAVRMLVTTLTIQECAPIALTITEADNNFYRMYL